VHQILGITFTGTIANLLRKKKEGYNLIVNPLIPSHTDEVFNRLMEFSLELLTLQKGSLDVSLADALFGGSHPNNFSSSEIKNGGKICLRNSL